MQSEPTNQPASAEPGWLQILVFGRRPRRTLARIAVLVIASFVTFRFVLLPIRIEGISMLPTYHTGQIRLINRLAYHRDLPQRGDIVSVRYAKPDKLGAPSIMLMKRIIALPGETLSFEAGRVFIDGQLLDEPYLKLPCNWQHEPITCGPDEYYIVGDNRSMPFYAHTQGRTKFDHIVGRLIL